MLEFLLDKPRILEIYLNNVEWGEGIFGAQAAARHYFRVDAARLAPAQAARLAVMLPAPKRFEKRPVGLCHRPRGGHPGAHAGRGAAVNATTLEIAAVAARLVSRGMEYAAAKRKAGREHGRRAELPSNEQVEDAVREHIELFCASTQPANCAPCARWRCPGCSSCSPSGRTCGGGVARHGDTAFGGADRPLLRRSKAAEIGAHQCRRRPTTAAASSARAANHCPC